MGSFCRPLIKQQPRRRAGAQAPAEAGRHRRPQAGHGRVGPEVRAVLRLPRRLRVLEGCRRGVAPAEHRHGGPRLPAEAVQAVHGPDALQEPRGVPAEEEAEGGQAVPLQRGHEDQDGGMSLLYKSDEETKLPRSKHDVMTTNLSEKEREEKPKLYVVLIVWKKDAGGIDEKYYHTKTGISQ